jgi:hypothetical protein
MHRVDTARSGQCVTQFSRRQKHDLQTALNPLAMSVPSTRCSQSTPQSSVRKWSQPRAWHTSPVSREAIAKLLGGRQCGRAGGQNLQLGELIRPDLQQAAGIGKLVDFIEHHHPLLHGSEKAFRVEQPFRHAWQITVQKLCLGQALCQDRLADPSRAGQPALEDLRLTAAVLPNKQHQNQLPRRQCQSISRSLTPFRRRIRRCSVWQHWSSSVPARLGDGCWRSSSSSLPVRNSTCCRNRSRREASFEYPAKLDSLPTLTRVATGQAGSHRRESYARPAPHD